ncbi:hypothetical protein COU00_02145 [Candidatus Falkowbacteria bacterium CG10_big_fil_rev_8_21_14_0_10_43_11]|uniref:Uncharacterized protein n=1 Tax=Candidatus Falkowbacteria bacterium CG10_big_fil_rev_8_21_14_0_10_43_11 TaxID=1974568 RepID=A0A2M6WM29_9BACT|nr:MAG: hypothetical protein COU00_02145 [Candidatus Falkowbacteria bacterium CG10_big_fil_rev_8_21_14_0_10_43_11]
MRIRRICRRTKLSQKNYQKRRGKISSAFFSLTLPLLRRRQGEVFPAKRETRKLSSKNWRVVFPAPRVKREKQRANFLSGQNLTEARAPRFGGKTYI